MSNLIGEIILVFIYFQVVVEEHGETQKLGAPCAQDLLMARFTLAIFAAISAACKY